MHLQIILGSTRRERVSARVGTWALNVALKSQFTHSEILDLREYPLSFMDEPASPQFNSNRAPAPATQRWLDKLDEADAYLLVCPEYNRALPGVLKNALDHVAFEMSDKPVTSITYGSSGGAQAHASLKIILPALRAVVLPSNVFLFPSQLAAIDEAGKFANAEQGADASLAHSVEQLHGYAAALAPLRSQTK